MNNYLNLNTYVSYNLWFFSLQEEDYESVTKLKDIINLPDKYVSIISFSRFFQLEKKNLPENFLSYNRLKTDYITMKIQSMRLSKAEPKNRGKYWHYKMLYLKKKLQQNYQKSKELYIPNPNEFDYIEYMKNNFCCLDGPTDERFIKQLFFPNSRFIFIPMDPFYLTKYSKYPRIFNYSNYFNPSSDIYKKCYKEKKKLNEKEQYKLDKQIIIWSEVITLNLFPNNLLEIAQDIINNILNNNFYALHYRHQGFNQQNEFKSEYINFLPNNKILYISSDSFHIIIDSIPKKYKIKSLQDIDLTKYNIPHKFTSLIEQIICIKSDIFIGTNFSTFTNQILNYRLHKNIGFTEISKYIDNKKNYIW